MELVKSSSSDLGYLQRKMASLAGAMAFESLLAAEISIACLVMMMGLLLQDGSTLPNLIGNDQRFPFSELNKKSSTELEAKRWK
ncbi:unnamed protein product [Lactuca virosa]|uniref:Uncharacterized protein n=1 Tax=Lactuca virosa TaxID=75947 RepID=A0AAU9MJ86_9ASTR|nr:unnamed protein product [Lactuca virosa]